MNRLITRPLLSAVLVVFMLTSCAPLPKPGTALTPEERESARKSCIARYTAGGAVGGGILGGLLGGKKTKLQSALIGAAAGGALAFALAWGHCLNVYSDLKSYPVADARTTARQIGYNPSQGYVTKIKNFSLNPQNVSPGGKVRLNGSYYIMAPEGDKDIKVTESRTVHFFDSSEGKWKELGTVDQEVTAALGTRKAEGSFEMPPDVPEGRYKITFKVSAKGEEDEATREMTVKKG
jgi:hypothetical protein